MREREREKERERERKREKERESISLCHQTLYQAKSDFMYVKWNISKHSYLL